MDRQVDSNRSFWDQWARYDPLWAVLSDPTKSGRRWDLGDFLETGRREVSLLMYQLRALGIEVGRRSAIDFGCGVGRLSQSLAEYFERVIGVDVSPEMIRLASAINRFPIQVRYVCNDRDDLAMLAPGEWDFIYSNVVLQHIEPPATLRYLSELLRVAAPGGVLVFQLPSHLRLPEEQPAVSTAMIGQAYRASIRVHSEIPQSIAPGVQLMLTASVTNISGHRWSQQTAGPIRLGNHWLSGSRRTMLVQDDGRAPLPELVEPGQTCVVTITISAPSEPGHYQLECDVVHEGISWFSDKGSETWAAPVTVGGAPDTREPLDDALDQTVSRSALSLPDISSLELPGPLPMHGVPRDVVLEVVEQNAGRLVHLEEDERCGREWVGYRYFVRKHA